MNADGRAFDTERLVAWLAGRGLAAHRVERLAGGASPRTYWRVHLAAALPNGRTTAVVMALPEDALAPTEHGAARAATAAAGETTAGELPWIAMARFLEGLDLPVPEFYVDDVAAGYVLLEDLGDERFFDRLSAVSPASRAALYGEALQLLADWQAALAGKMPPGGAPTFSREHLLAELAEFQAMALEARLGITLSPGERAVFDAAGATLCRELLDATPQVLAHRDFQSQNLMVTARGLVLIDFQDAFVAPDVYDLVALLRDSYVVLAPAEVEHGLRRFALLTGRTFEGLAERFHLQTIQRKLKDAGRFETLARRGKTHFLAYFADSIGYVMHALEKTDRFPELRALLLERLPEARIAVAGPSAP